MRGMVGGVYVLFVPEIREVQVGHDGLLADVVQHGLGYTCGCRARSGR